MNGNGKKTRFGRAHTRIDNRSAFLTRLAALLKEGYTFHDGLILLLPYHNKNYIELLRQIENDLKAGLGTTIILSRLGFSVNILLPVIISEVDGRLWQALEGIADRLKKAEARQKKLKNMLLYPLVLFLFMGVLLVVFRNYFLPNLQALTLSSNDESTGFVSILPIIVAKIPDVMISTWLVFFVALAVAILIYRKLLPVDKIRFFMAIPILGSFFSKMKTRDFAGEMGSLLNSGISMQNALDVLVEQKVDPIMSEIAQEMKGHVIYGENFDQAIQLTNGLRDEFSSYAKHGSDTGHLAKELILYSENLNETLEEEIGKWLALLQPFLFTILAICILAAYLALLLPVYDVFNDL